MQEKDIELRPDLSAREYEENEEFLQKKTAFENSVGFTVSKVQFLKSLVKNASF